MTDTTRGDVLAPARAATDARPAFLFSPWFDFLCLGGGATVICLIVAAALPNGIPETRRWVHLSWF